MTNLLFHSGNYTDLQISGAGNINIKNLKVYSVKSIWTD